MLEALFPQIKLNVINLLESCFRNTDKTFFFHQNLEISVATLGAKIRSIKPPPPPPSKKKYMNKTDRTFN